MFVYSPFKKYQNFRWFFLLRLFSFIFIFFLFSSLWKQNLTLTALQKYFRSICCRSNYWMFLKYSIENFFISKSIWKLYSKPVFRYREEWYLIRSLPYKVIFDIPFKLGVITFKHNLLFLHIPSDLEKNPPKQSLCCKYKRVTREQKGHRFKCDNRLWF